MEPKIEVRTDTRDTLGQTRTVFIAECEGIRYEFDPLAQAVKDNGEVKAAALEHAKTGVTRAKAGALLKWFSRKAENLPPEEVTALWDSVWKFR